MDRIQQLQLIGRKNRTPEEQREYQTLKTRKSREKSDENQIKDSRLAAIAKASETVEEFWEANRRVADPELIRDYLAQQELVADQMFWLDKGFLLPPDDERYLSFEDGLADLDAFIEEHGYIRDAFNYKSTFLKEFEPMWAIWLMEDRKDPIWGEQRPFWKDAKRLRALIEEENDPTRVYCLYGIRTGIPEFHTMKWKQEHTPLSGKEK